MRRPTKYYDILSSIKETFNVVNETAVAVLEYSREATLRNVKTKELAELLVKDNQIKRFKEVDGQRVAYTPEELIDQFLDKLEEIDTTPNKKYVPLMFKLYAKGGTKARIEDLVHTVIGSMNILEEAKRLNLLEDSSHLDVLRYKSIEELEDRGFYYEDKVKAEKVKRDQAKIDKETGGNFKILADTPRLKVIQILDYAASTYWGKGASWCVRADSDSGRRHCESYLRQGPLITIIPKEGKITKRGDGTERPEKYQLSVKYTNATPEEIEAGAEAKFSTIELADENNYHMDIGELIKRYPELSEILLNAKGVEVIGSLLKKTLSTNSNEELFNMMASITENVMENLDSLNKELRTHELFVLDGKLLEPEAVNAALIAGLQQELDEATTIQHYDAKRAAEGSAPIIYHIAGAFATRALKNTFYILKSKYGNVKIKSDASITSAGYVGSWLSMFKWYIQPVYSNTSKQFLFKFTPIRRR